MALVAMFTPGSPDADERSFGEPGQVAPPEAPAELPLPPSDVDRLTVLMGHALVEAAACRASGDVPVGAVVADATGSVIATGRNERELRQDPTAHAELLALRAAAAALGSWRLTGCTLVVTLEPCAMCAGAVVLARVPRLVLAAWDARAGATGSTRDLVRDPRLNHRVDVVGGIRAGESATLLRTFFAARRHPRPDPS